MNGGRAKLIRKSITYQPGDKPAVSFFRKLNSIFLGELEFHLHQASSWRRRYRKAKKLYTRGNK
jgi:hypothetical protein